MSNDVVQTIIHFVVTFVFSLFFVMTAASLGVWGERKVQAWAQDRWGPLHYGPQGILQAILDPMKLLLKEDVKARGIDNIVFRIAPIVFFAPVVAAFVILPFSPYLTAGALGTGIIYYVALSSLDIIGVFMAGWGSNNKYALIGGLRSTAQMISYELPLVLSLAGVVMLTSVVAPGCVGAHADLGSCGIGSISLSQIVAAQMRPGAPWLWFVILQPLGLLVYYICGLAETNRTPFDLPEAESELVAGYLTEYSGLRWAMFMLGEYGNLTIVSALATTLFFGGWSGPGAAVGFWTGHLGHFWGGVVFNIICTFWFVTKMVFTIFVYMLVRATLPRMRADQLMRFAWLFLIPLTLVNILLTGAVLLIPVSGALQLVFAGVSNWILCLVVFFGFRRVTGVSLTGKTPRWIKAQPAAARAASGTGQRAPTAPELAGAATRGQ